MIFKNEFLLVLPLAFPAACPGFLIGGDLGLAGRGGGASDDAIRRTMTAWPTTALTTASVLIMITRCDAWHSGISSAR